MDARTFSLAPSSRRRGLFAALVLLFALLSVQYSLKARENRSAFLRWREQVVDLDQGIDIYQRHNYPNPPVMALLLLPLAKLPPLAGALGWFWLKAALTLLALGWLFRLVGEPGRPFPFVAEVLTVLLGLRPIMGDLSHGNVNLLILFLVIAALIAFRRRRDLTAGLLLGLAIAYKVTPALFVPYFLWKRSWKLLAGCAAGVALFLWPGLLPAALLGWQRNEQLLHSWADRMIEPYVVQGIVTSEHQNQSLPGLFYRLLTDSPSFSTWDYEENRRLSVEYHNLASLDPRLVGGLVKGCMLLFAGLGVWLCRAPTQPRASWRLAAEYSVVVLGMLLFCERTWKHHCVTLLLPFAVLSYQLTAFRPGRRLRGYLIGTLLLVGMLMALTSTSILDNAAKLAQVYGAYVWGYLLLLAALGVVLKREGAAFQSALPYFTATRPVVLVSPPATRELASPTQNPPAFKT